MLNQASDREELVPQSEQSEAEARNHHLQSLAQSLAEGHRLLPPGQRAPVRPPLTDLISGYASVFRDANRYFQGASEQELAVSYAAEWMLDNYYVVAQAIREVREDLPRRYYRELPKLSEGPLAGYPRVYDLAFQVILADRALLDLDRAARFVYTYQTVAPLKMGELWALPIMLRLGILQSLAQAVARITRVRSEAEIRLLLPFMHSAEPGAADGLFTGLSDEDVVANCILSLRTLAAQDWKVFFEDLSLVEQILRHDPAHLYAGMDFETRDRYRKVVEEIASAAQEDEIQVARAVVRMAQTDFDRDQAGLQRQTRAGAPAGSAQSAWDGFTTRRTSHVGYYLLDRGRLELERQLRPQPGAAGQAAQAGLVLPWYKRFQRWILAHPSLVYLGSIGALALLFTALLALYASRSGGSPAAVLLTGLLVLVPSLTVAVSLVNWIITRTIKPGGLPKMDFQEGIPPECATLVCVPALLSGPEEVRSLLQQLEQHYLRNLDPRLSFALLTDLKDADSQHLPEDDVSIEQAASGVRSLNRKYGQGGEGPFLLLHRERRWNRSEARWMGWERKRGKLQELNRLILSARDRPRPEAGDSGQNGGQPWSPVQDTSFKTVIGDLERLADIRYVVTLDADTILPRDGARRLVATLAHPLNRAGFDAGGRVVSGYTILQPRTEISPASSSRSWFTRIFAGDRGLDLYSRAVSDVYQDFFGEGIYVGKGIYDVAAFARSLEGRIPENALLSHDLFEGIHGRVGLVTDIVLIEDYPPNYLAQARRQHRWVRGDWQLLPWLVPVASGAARSDPLPTIARWKILDNLRRSLVSPVLFILFAAGWLWLPGLPWAWTLVGMATQAVPMLTTLANVLAQMAGGKYSRQALFSARMDVSRWLLALAFLPYEALLNLHAIVTTLVRVLITRKAMLQWTTSAETARWLEGDINLRLTWREMAQALLLSVGLSIAILVFRPLALPAAVLLLLAWMFSPEIAYWISRPIQVRPEPLTGEQKAQLRLLARRTWMFFEQFVGPEDHWLPPDHFQEAPLGVVAHRTSPTNIGLALLSSLGAYDLGYLGALDLAARLRTTFETLEELERDRGHFLNWYDTRTLEVLTPRYISTVDSGNLAACLVVLGQGCQAVLRQPVFRWEAWEGFLDLLRLLMNLLGGFEQHEAKSPAGVQLKPDRRSPPAAAEGADRQGEDALRHTEVGALLNQLQGIEAQVLAVKDRPEARFDLLYRLFGKAGSGWDEINQQLVDLVEAQADRPAAEDLRRLRAYTLRIQQHLSQTWREVDLLLPWLIWLARPPALFDQVDLEPGLLEAWQDLLAVLPSSPGLEEIDAAAREAAARLDRLEERLNNLADPKDGRSQDLSGLPHSLVEDARDWCRELAGKLESAGMTAKVLQIGFQDIRRQADAYLQEMDFGFLYDAQRQVFHIGYNASEGRLDHNYYDLLASEARIASLVAIAKGDVPQDHWLHLARPLTQVNGFQALLSWSATMFEYLMPLLMARIYRGTLLHQSSYAAVDWQIHYGEEKKAPWGISESGYYRFDANQYYQYRAFGVPGLGYKRGLGEDLVVAPYASLLALPLRPQAVVENLQELTRLGMLGAYGLYESIDFTKDRLPLGVPYAIVREYMSHHQAMILLSLVNYLQQDIFVQRFHDDPRIQSVELLLQEQIPPDAPLEEPHADEGAAVRPVQPAAATSPWPVPVQAPQPRVHYLSNGRYSVLISGSGAGYSSWQGFDLTRWRADMTLNDWGMWVYVKDLDSGRLWSASYQPAAVVPQEQEVFFNAHMVEFKRRDEDLTLVMEVTVPPDDDIEVRRISLTNHSGRPRRLLIASYAELVLSEMAADQRHPAFNKLFIESEWISASNTLVFRRRPRSEEEEPVFLAHSIVVEPSALPAASLLQAIRPRQPVDVFPRSGDSLWYESDRMRFLGRGRTARSPAVFEVEGSRLQVAGDRRNLQPGTFNLQPGTTGATLDPILSIGQVIELEPHGSADLAYLTAASGSQAGALASIRRYQTWHMVGRAFDNARSHAEVELRQLGLTTEQLERIQQLLSCLFYPNPALRADAAVLAANQKGQPALWAYGISGDYPILLARVSRQEELPLIHELLLAHTYWRRRNLKIDLVILNLLGTGYEQDLNNQIHRLLARTGSDGWLNRRGGIFLIAAGRMGEQDQQLLETAARVILDGERGPLAEQLGSASGLQRLPSRLPPFTPIPPEEAGEVEPRAPVGRPQDLQFDNGWGGFSPDGGEYVIYFRQGGWTPAPWVNVIANEKFGFMVSEAGGGNTWASNSGENRLTPWSNDPVADIPGEAIYLRDEETAEIWSPTPLPAGAVENGSALPYLVRHGAGYTIFEHNSHGLEHRLRLFVPPDDPLKIVQLRLVNKLDRVRRITVTFYAEWVLGYSREVSQQYIIPEFEGESQALLARNPYNPEFSERVAFAAASKPLHGLTADRTEFLGRMGDRAAPAALKRIGLSGTVQAGLDPCAALQLHIDLQPGGSEEVYFLLGQGMDREDALRLVRTYQQAGQVAEAWEAGRRFWEELLGTVTVKTPEPAMDLLLNRWLLYQALSCRIWGRSAFYQSSGAYGFRDQLQDVLSLLYTRPDLAREHLLRSARHQFEAGDVLHWWHPPSGRGVRTRFSDDLLWLPYVTSEYVFATGDESVLKEKEPFLRAPLLEPGEEERYGHYASTAETYSLFEHCRRALEKGSTSGRHGLPLMGAGDWNDGMNRVGIEGRGESVWLAWFLYDNYQRFARLCERLGEASLAARWRLQADELRQAVEASAWDGRWYLRAFYDDGSPLGSAQNNECQIDSLAQSWAVLSEAGDPERARRGMQSVSERLVRPQDRLLLLFTPPFDKTRRDPGYIKGYLPGIRENGGQYTHAALWAVWAFARLGQGDYAEELFRMINPIYHSDTPEKAQRYRVEPYVIAADVYSMPPHVGRGGWTWYTGSSGWMYRLGLEAILGLRRVEGGFTVDPCIPKDWPGYEIVYRLDHTCYRIRVENPHGVSQGVQQLSLDGEALKDGVVLMAQDGRDHQVRVVMGPGV